MAVKNPPKKFPVVIYSYLKDTAFTADKRDANFLTRDTKGVPFLSKMVYKRKG